MLIGYLKLPNKWASTAAVENKPFIYRNCPPVIYTANNMWGNIIKVDPWMNNYKLISQDCYSITEYWCINLCDGEHDQLLVPVLMKKFGNELYSNNTFLFKNGIFDLLVETNRLMPNFNMTYIQQYGVAELLWECLTGGSCLFQDWEPVIRKICTNGSTGVRFNSGVPFTIDALLHKCVLVDPFARPTMSLLNDSADLTDMGIHGENDLLNYFRENIPVNLANNIVDIDWIGECILVQNITNFDIGAVDQACVRTSNSQNLMMILSDVSKREELINVPNCTSNTIVEDYAMSYDDCNFSRHDDNYTYIIDCVDTICTAFILDSATTVALELDLRSDGKLKIIDRVYGYGLASVEQFTQRPHAHNVFDIEFSLRDLLEVLNAWKIRCIKTYNEELFITITYNGGNDKSYYINLITHACVSGCLFSA